MVKPETDWTAYRACPVCKTSLGDRCFSRSGRVVDGRPDGAHTFLDRPHRARKLRTRKAFTSAPLAH